jgi:hypothetical protein
MLFAHDADVALDPKRLTADALRQMRERAHGEIDGTGLEPRIEMLGIELHRRELDVRRFLAQEVQ